MNQSKKKILRKRLQTREDRILTLANLISISRIFMAIPLTIALYQEQKNWTQILVYFVLIILSDMIDGFVARKAGEVTKFGKIIDPVADKICLLVVAIYLIYLYPIRFSIFFGLLAIRDIIIGVTGIYLMRKGSEVFQANWTGKFFIVSTTLMMMMYILIEPSIFPKFIGIMQELLYAVSLVLMGISTYYYMKRYFQYFGKHNI
ncbi:MAG: CDP-alcohol phosphatidyltransferase family protein [Candidatus Marinimicrobia bacterium]|nr:CDP-alcohol phosphatidyltransferase family protein [Candidatus Neomarinimicrobiota bacterium]MBL7022669.1 CDP-alcohol phosphatidyltransferase family protein [Candidatus Neomarinimicrobiota bacterium]MBL7109937.1 CDP-alcohol phosphatidyltransferase family protein [Candidatus Neomarinimicrobiota bacterium]